MARVSMGPRHTIGALPSTNWPTEMWRTPCAIGGMIISSTTVGPLSSEPMSPGTEWP